MEENKIKPFRYVFFGTPQFAAIVLERLIRANMPPTALVCNPDRPVGRKQVITPPPTKQVVREKVASSKGKIEIFQPKNLKDAYYLLHATNYDFFIVAAYAKILPKEILEIPRLGTIGVHPSLLPKYRGPSPIQSAILAGEKETGVSLFLMDEQLDHGPIITSKKVTINNLFSNSRELENRLAEISAELLIETLPKFVKGELTPLSQDESQATYTKKFTSEDAFVSEKDLEAATSGSSPEKAPEILHKIHALNPEPGVWTIENGKRMKLLEAKIINSQLQLTKIQKEGKKPEDAALSTTY